ncbi:MAG: PLD nuclease N-terminal domain-containing protein [Alistipes sp.]
MLGLWQLFVIGIVILWCVALVLLINLKVSSVNKLLWALIVTVVPLFGSIVFLVWRKHFLKQACESGQTKR